MKIQLDQKGKDEVFYELGSASAYAKAIKENWDVVLPNKDELFIDIDDSASARLLDELLPILNQYFEAVVTRRGPSPSGQPDKEHVVVKFERDLQPTERFLLQAILGSDRKRELLGWMMYDQCEDPTPTLFFEKKGANDLPIPSKI